MSGAKTRSDDDGSAIQGGSSSKLRWSSLVSSSFSPSLERMAGTAAKASQEAARYTADHAKRYGHKVQWQNKSGRAPPGQDFASTAEDWSRVGDKYCSMGWYDLELVKDVAADASGMPKADTRRNKRGYVKGNLSTIATLEDVDRRVTSPIFKDKSNVIKIPEDGDGDAEGEVELKDEPSPVEVGKSSSAGFFKASDTNSAPQVASGEGPRAYTGAGKAQPVSGTDTTDAAPSVSSTLKPVFRKSAVVVSSLLKKGTVAAAAKLSTYADASTGPDSSGNSSRAGEAASRSAAGAAQIPGLESFGDNWLEHLKKEAAEGNETAEAQMRQLFGSPGRAMKPTCGECGQTFGVSLYRHHCKHCGESFCHEHAKGAHPIPKMGLPAPQRVCDSCKHVLEVEDWRDRVAWREERIDAYLDNRLIDYFDPDVDTKLDKAWRIMDGAIYVGKNVPLGSTVKVSVKVLDAMRKYGTTGIAALVFRREFVEAVDTLRLICGVDKEWAMNVHETSAAMFYLMAKRRGERGDDPDGEHRAHRGFPVLQNEELNYLLRVSSLPLYLAYRDSLELQVLCNSTAWSLVFHKENSKVHQPAFALLACRATMTCALVVRGTRNLPDIITDTQTLPVPFPPLRNQGKDARARSVWRSGTPTTMACAGMARAADWLHREVLRPLVKLRREGHEVLITGHSLGAGVACLLGHLVKEAIPDVRVVAYATPACANLELAQDMQGTCTNVILHDDILPRVAPKAVNALLDEAKSTKEYWAKHLQDDMDAVVDRAKGLWAPLSRTTSRPEASPIEDGSATTVDEQLKPSSPPQGPPLPSRPAYLVGGSSGGGGHESEGVGHDVKEGAGSGDAAPLVDLYVPGRIVHIYSQRGVYRASEIPRDHECLQAIPMYGNMLSDHDNKKYFWALQEIAAVREAEASGVTVPEWVPFSASDECQICKADFFWQSTLRSEAQRARDKHNCHMCGALVCNGCSRNRKPLPKYGVTQECRVCDRCFFRVEISRLP